MIQKQWVCARVSSVQVV